LLKNIKLIEINYHSHHKLDDPQLVIQKHEPANLFANELVNKTDVSFIKHMNYEGELVKNAIHYYFLKRSNSVFQIPRKTHQLAKKIQPDLVLVQGFIFPLQVIFLRKKLGKKPVILVQHRGESPAGKKKFFQKMADKFIDGYLFAAKGNAEPWLKAGIIRNTDRCFEMPSSSTLFRKQDKEKSLEITGMTRGINFLWVGRLNANKDPITVLKAFEKYLSTQKNAFLSMIYSEEDMEKEIKQMVEASPDLSAHVKLVGKLPHAELEYWFSAADYFISASWKESGSYSLTEAMACGCVPVVSNIPPSMKAIDNAKAGYFFTPGDPEDL